MLLYVFFPISSRLVDPISFINARITFVLRHIRTSNRLGIMEIGNPLKTFVPILGDLGNLAELEAALSLSLSFSLSLSISLSLCLSVSLSLSLSRTKVVTKPWPMPPLRCSLYVGYFMNSVFQCKEPCFFPPQYKCTLLSTFWRSC